MYIVRSRSFTLNITKGIQSIYFLTRHTLVVISLSLKLSQDFQIIWRKTNLIVRRMLTNVYKFECFVYPCIMLKEKDFFWSSGIETYTTNTIYLIMRYPTNTPLTTILLGLYVSERSESNENEKRVKFLDKLKLLII